MKVSRKYKGEWSRAHLKSFLIVRLIALISIGICDIAGSGELSGIVF